jgi:hypothetical protein
MRIIKLLKYLPVLLCLLIAISVSEPSNKRFYYYSQNDGPLYTAGMEQQVESKIKVVAVVTFTGKSETILIERARENGYRGIHATFHVVKIEDILYDELGIGRYAYVMEQGDSWRAPQYGPGYGGPYQKGEKLLMYLSGFNITYYYPNKSLPIPLLQHDYPVLNHLNHGYSSRVVHSDGTLSLRDGCKIEYPVYGYFRTVDEARAYFSEFRSANPE